MLFFARFVLLLSIAFKSIFSCLPFIGFFRSVKLFPLDRSGGFGGNIVHNAINIADLVNNAVGNTA